jgi:dipeptidyl aminopeptidase/acylaminoacyl peptidase
MYGMGAGQAITPDGHVLVFDAELSTQSSGGGAVSKLALINLEESGRPAAKLLEPDKRIAGGAGGNFANVMTFAPDGKSLAYIIRDKGVDNIWVQPLDGGAGRQITNFTSENIAEFRWSPDGKTLAVTRTHNVSDVVLLREK